MTPFSKHASGLLVAGFTAVEIDIIADLAAQVAGMLADLAGTRDADPLFDLVGIGGSVAIDADPAIARLLPDAYANADESSDFRQLTERSLAKRKVLNAGVVIASLERSSGAVSGDPSLGEAASGDPSSGDPSTGGAVARIELDGAEAQAWLRTLSDIRLTIAARLGIENDGDAGDTDTDAAVTLHDLYDWLAYVTESLIEALEAPSS